MRKPLLFETNAKCHSERAKRVEESVFNRFLRFATQSVAPVEMTLKPFNSTNLLLIVIALGLMTCLALAVSPYERQQLNNFKVSTLKGLPGVAVTVKVARDNPDTLSLLLLKENQIQDEVAIALQSAGVEVLPPTPDVGLYIVQVKIAGGGPDAMDLAINVQSSLMQIVHLSRDTTIKTEAQTWPAAGQGRFGLVPVAMAKSMITRTVKEQAKEFAEDFKAANPKPSAADSNAK
jgi:hypothetical protein